MQVVTQYELDDWMSRVEKAPWGEAPQDVTRTKTHSRRTRFDFERYHKIPGPCYSPSSVVASHVQDHKVASFVDFWPSF